MKKGRCNFDNFIRNASAFFAVFSLVFLTGCSDLVEDYLRDNNLLGPENYDSASSAGNNSEESEAPSGRDGVENIDSPSFQSKESDSSDDQSAE